MITRNEALELLNKYVKNDRMIKHCIASEAVMKNLALYFNEDAQKWALAGLLHDLDVEITDANPYTHGKESVNILSNYDLPTDLIDAIAMHNEVSAGKERTTLFQHALAASETITGLITATTMVYPDKKISLVKAKSIVKRMKEKAFAASVKRENIMECEKIGININDFAELSLKAMQQIANELEL